MNRFDSLRTALFIGINGKPVVRPDAVLTFAHAARRIALGCRCAECALECGCGRADVPARLRGSRLRRFCGFGLSRSACRRLALCRLACRSGCRRFARRGRRLARARRGRRLRCRGVRAARYRLGFVGFILGFAVGRGLIVSLSLGLCVLGLGLVGFLLGLRFVLLILGFAGLDGLALVLGIVLCGVAASRSKTKAER